MKLEAKLRDAGVDVDRPRLYEAACTALRRSRLDESRALPMFVSALREDRKLLDAIASWYLAQCAADMRGPNAEGGSHVMGESQPTPDPTSPPLSESGRASQLADGRQAQIDRPAAPSMQSGSHISSDGQGSIDPALRPSTQEAASRGAVGSQFENDRRPPAPTKLRAGAMAVLSSSVFDKRIVEHFEHKWGDITQQDYLNLAIKNAFSTEVQRGLSKVKWPDLHTPLREFETEATVERLAAAAETARQNAVNAAKALTHA